jgi:lysophospholipase L1-like esterase
VVWRFLAALVLAALVLLVLFVTVPVVRIAGLNGAVWFTARALPEKNAALQRALDPWVPEGAVLLVGDSLAAQMPPRLAGARVVTFATGGSLIEDAARNLAGRESLKRVSALVVLAGTNDLLHRPADESERRLRDLLAALPPGLPAILCSVPPVDPAAHRERRPEAIRAWNERLPAIAASRPGTRLADLERALADENGLLPAAWHQGDGLHLNAAGNARLATALRQALADLPSPAAD